MNSAESGALKSYVTQYHIMDPTPIALLYKSYDISEIKKRNLKGIPNAAYLQIKEHFDGIMKNFLTLFIFKFNYPSKLINDIKFYIKNLEIQFLLQWF